MGPKNAACQILAKIQGVRWNVEVSADVIEADAANAQPQPPKSLLQVEVLPLCDCIGVNRCIFEGWGDDEFNGLTLDIAKSLGIPENAACQILAKIQGVRRDVELSTGVIESVKK